MPAPPFSGETISPMMTAPRSVERVSHVGQRRRPHLGVPDDALAPAGLGPPHLELGLHQQHQVAARADQGEQGVEHRAQRDEGQVADDQVDRPAELVEVDRPDVGALPDGDPGVLPHLRVELAPTHVDGDDRRRSPAAAGSR